MSEPRDTWSALAHPVRRTLLDELRDGPRTTGELVAVVPHLSRYAVMQHLGVLEEAGLVLVRRQGRQRLNFLNPAPLEEVRQRWLNRFSEGAGRGALALKRHAEQREQREQGEQREQPSREEQEQQVTTSTGVARAVHIETELRINAEPARVFTALTMEQHRWYPYNYGGDRVRDIVFEPRVGGRLYEDWGDGAGHFYGIVTHYDPPTALTLRGGLPGGTVLEQTFALEADADADAAGDATIVRHSMVAFGELTDEDVDGIKTHGDLGLFEPQLRAWVEQGVSVRR
jgi:DNA-binding transcriptional ArsR family regulator/uncharacterized protein YndB with AHSA1/START domain